MLEVYCLRGEVYQRISASEILPNLDLAMLADYAIASDPLAAALEFRDRIRAEIGR